MRAINRRVQRLERSASTESEPPWRVVLTIAGTGLEVSASTVEKIHNDNGTITGLVTLAGSRQDTADDDPDPFRRWMFRLRALLVGRLVPGEATDISY